MKNAHKRWGLGAALILVAASLAMATTTQASAAPQPNACGSQIGKATARAQGFGGVVPAVGNCPSSNAAAMCAASDPAKGTPPLIFHGGSVMDTRSTGPLIVTPDLLEYALATQCAAFVQAAHQHLSRQRGAGEQAGDFNVFSVAKEYFGINGHIRYQIRLGFPVLDSNPLPADSCQVASTDTTGIYAEQLGLQRLSG